MPAKRPARSRRAESKGSVLSRRGSPGIYQHVSARHLKRYVGEFDFRYSNRRITDAQRTDEALNGIEGKRLLYKKAGEEALA